MKNYLKTELNEFDQVVGSQVAEQTVSFKATDLYGSSVNLVCLKQQGTSSEQLSQIWQTVSSEPDQRCWTYLPYSAFKSKSELREALDDFFAFPDSIHYLIEVDQKILGWIALLNIREQARVLEIGNVYFSDLIKQSTAATEALYLLLSSVFEQGFRRVEWKCDALNLASKQAALRYGFEFEGIFRQDRIYKGRNRNTAWFSMLDEEWGVLAKAYQAWLSKENFDPQGVQKLRLNDFVRLYKH